MSRLTTAPTYRWSVEEYNKLGETHVFHEDDRVELLDGDIIVLAPIGTRHMKAVRRLINVLARKYGQHCLVDAQNPLMIDGFSVPQPDILLLRSSADTRDSAPIPEDVLLLIEVADSSLAYDSRDKRDAYARTGIAEYWLLDLTQDQMHVFRDPHPQGYRSEQIISDDGSVAPLAFPEQAVALAEILPPCGYDEVAFTATGSGSGGWKTCENRSIASARPVASSISTIAPSSFTGPRATG